MDVALYRKWFIPLILGLYAITLFLPAIYAGGQPPVPGYTVLAIGWLGVLILNFSWIANITFLVAVWMTWRQRYGDARLVSGSGMLLSFQTFFTTEWYFNEGNASKISMIGVGGYVWVLVMIMTFAINTLFHSMVQEGTGGNATH